MSNWVIEYEWPDGSARFVIYNKDTEDDAILALCRAWDVLAPADIPAGAQVTIRKLETECQP